MQTPWGRAEEIVRLERGVSWVSTPGHGGFMVAQGVAKKLLTPEAQSRGYKYCGYLAYEEDCDYAIVLFEHQEWAEKLGIKSVNGLLSNLSTYNPLYLIERGIDPMQDEFQSWQERQLEQKMRQDKHPDLIVAAWGDWADWVPKGKVGVSAADAKRYLVSEADYQKMTGPKLISKIQHEAVSEAA